MEGGETPLEFVKRRRRNGTDFGRIASELGASREEVLRLDMSTLNWPTEWTRRSSNRSIPDAVSFIRTKRGQGWPWFRIVNRLRTLGFERPDGSLWTESQVEAAGESQRAFEDKPIGRNAAAHHDREATGSREVNSAA